MTLRARLALAHLVLLAVCVTALGFGVYAYVDAKLHNEFEHSLRTSSATLRGLLNSVSDPDEIRRRMESTRTTQADLSGWVETSYPQEAFVYTSENFAGVERPDVPVGQVVVYDTERGRMALYAVDFAAFTEPNPSARQQIIKAGERNAANRDPGIKVAAGKLVVARPVESVDASLALLRTILILGGLLVLAIAAVLGLGLTSALLQPLERMRQAAHHIGSERDFHLRLPVEEPRHELGRLAGSVNDMLTELEAAHAAMAGTLDAQRRFVGDASHELRTPVTAIRTNVEFLRRAPDARPADRDEALADVVTEVERMEALVGDLLALARLEAAVGKAHRPVRLDHLLGDVHRDALRLAPAGVTVGLAPMPRLSVDGDRDDLRRAIWNLVGNALKYLHATPGATPRPDSTRRERVDLSLALEGDLAVLRVRDTGIGIASQDVPFVFDRFWRAPEARGRSGSGLGLAITKWVVQAHGGVIDVDSTPGQGTTFTVRLPALPRHARIERGELNGHGGLAQRALPAPPRGAAGVPAVPS